MDIPGGHPGLLLFCMSFSAFAHSNSVIRPSHISLSVSSSFLMESSKISTREFCSSLLSYNFL